MNNKQSPLRIVLIALAIALISYVPLHTIYNITTKGQTRSKPIESPTANPGQDTASQPSYQQQPNNQ